MTKSPVVKKAPVGFAALALIGPSLVWVSEYIGSGEVIIATRAGALLGTGILWAVVIGIFLKFWIGMAGARYTVTTGEGMIDLFDRLPGPAHWAVWLIMVIQLAAAAFSIGSVASAGGIFLAHLTHIPRFVCGWLITLIAFFVSWKGEFRWLKISMSVLVVTVIIGVIYVSVNVFPAAAEFFKGLIPSEPFVPQWAIEKGVDENPWKEVLPLLGWGAGGFASQVWYSYWVIGAGYGMTSKDGYGKSADLKKLKQVDRGQALVIKSWNRFVTMDASIAMVIGIVATSGFLIAGAGILGETQVVPEGEMVALQLSELFAANWGSGGAFLFVLGGTAALLSTQIGQLAGWPRLLSDTFRLCLPETARKYSWKTQFRTILVLLSIASMVIIFTLGYKPVVLVKFAAVFEGLLLTPFQAAVVFFGLYFIMPRFFNDEVKKLVRPHWSIGVGLVVAAFFFTYFCVVQLPAVLF
ncbi:MAG: Nramp family divalent metal transporter [Bacteroidales bacterium]|nr:Nramp family divalent metal transporter [Bacteroidales bacterium]